MMGLSRDHAGTGAMLARLVHLGARAGLSAEATLLHVLDGAPLAEPERAPASIADIAERLRAADHVVVPREAARAVADLKIDIGGPLVAFPTGADGDGRLLTIEEALRPPEKREKIANLYGSTALRNGPIAEMTGSTPGSVSFFLNEFRKAGDPRVLRGDLLRGITLSGANAPAEGPMAVDGVGAERSTERPIQSDDILPAGFNGEGGRADPVPDVLPEWAGDTSDDVSLCFHFPEAGPGGDQDLLDAMNAESFARELGLSALGGGEECAERDAGSSDPGGDVAAFPAPPAVREDESEKGIARPQPPALDPPETADTAARPAGPGPDLPETADGMVGGDPVAAAPCHAEETGDEGVDSASTLTGGESAAGEAGAFPPVPASSPQFPAGESATDGILRLWRDTLLKQSEIGELVGKTAGFVGAIVSQKRKAAHPAVAAGDASRERAETESLQTAAVQAKAPATRRALHEKLFDGYGASTRPQKQIGAELGLKEGKVSQLLKTARHDGDARILAGDAARKAEAERIRAAEKAEREQAKAAAREAAAEARPEAEALPPAPAASASAPASRQLRETDPPEDLVLLKAGEILAIDRGWIVGPVGVLKGFPLINATLMTLAGGELFDAAVVAKKCGVRSGDAVLAQLNHWEGDLAGIGVEVVRVGKAEVRLRRSACPAR